MVKIQWKRDDIIGGGTLRVEGHAKYSKAGEPDVLCAYLSGAVDALAVGLESCGLLRHSNSDFSGRAVLDIEEKGVKAVEAWLQFAACAAKQYPENVCIEGTNML